MLALAVPSFSPLIHLSFFLFGNVSCGSLPLYTAAAVSPALRKANQSKPASQPPSVPKPAETHLHGSSFGSTQATETKRQATRPSRTRSSCHLCSGTHARVPVLSSSRLPYFIFFYYCKKWVKQCACVHGAFFLALPLCLQLRATPTHACTKAAARSKCPSFVFLLSFMQRARKTILCCAQTPFAHVLLMLFEWKWDWCVCAQA